MLRELCHKGHLVGLGSLMLTNFNPVSLKNDQDTFYFVLVRHKLEVFLPGGTTG